MGFCLTRVFRRSVGTGVLLSTSCPKCVLMCRQCRAGSSCFIFKKQWYSLLQSFKKKSIWCTECVMSYWMILKQMHPVTTSSFCALVLSFQEVLTRNHKKMQMQELGYSQFRSVGLWEVTAELPCRPVREHQQPESPVWLAHWRPECLAWAQTPGFPDLQVALLHAIW